MLIILIYIVQLSCGKLVMVSPPVEYERFVA